MTTRKYTSRSQQTTLTSSVTSGALTFPVVSATTVLGGATVSAGQTFTVVIDPDTALEEVVDITAVSANNLTVTRAIDGSGAQDHSAGAVVRHMIIGRDLREANAHQEASNGVHGLASTSSVVGTQDAQTLYNKTLIAPVLTATTENDAGIAFQGSTVDGYTTTLSVVDPTANRTVTLPNTSGTVVLQDSADTLTNKTLTSPTINGSPVITGLSSAGMSASSATPKNYVDSILGSATAASTSAASAATSASSAATSASSAATSASSALTSQTAAATSASSAATSASSASTYLTSVQTSATSAANSATAAASSATTAANSVATITTSANSAATSAASAATSAASAAASTSAAATSAASAATSASSAAASASSITGSVAAAATSATSAANSATAAATSASSASTSASSALTSQTAAATSAASAATSQTAAATSASSAATSASSAATSASSAATSASSALTSQTAAATSATSSASSFTSMDQKYLGAKSADPTLNNQGGALATGATYFNTATNTMRVYNGSTWSNMTSTANITMFKYTASGGETSKSGADDNSATLGYTVGIEQVYLNGALLVRGADYVATTGTSITGLAALTAGDILTVLAFTPFSVATAVPLTTFTAKGDLAVGSGSSTVGTLGVGSDGSTLVANSANASGLGWNQNFAAGKNKIINGDFGIWQRGTSFSTDGAYTSDRWIVDSNATFSATRQTFTPGTAPVAGYEGQYFLEIAKSAGGTYCDAKQRIEDVRAFAGQTVTLSAWMKVASGTASVEPYYQQSFGSGGSAGVVSTITAQTINTTWTRYSFTFTLPSVVGKTIGAGSFLEIYVPRIVTSGAVTIDIWGVQLEAGSVATAFQTATGTLQGELAACQRYYYNSKNAAPSNPGYGLVASQTQTSFNGQYQTVAVKFPVTMRAVPTMTFYDRSGTAGQLTYLTSTSSMNGSDLTGPYSNGPDQTGVYVSAYNEVTRYGFRGDYAASAEL